MENLQAPVIVANNYLAPFSQSWHDSQFEEKKVEMRDWCNLEIDILETVIKRLDPVDSLKFGGVCSPWRSSRSLHRTCRNLAPPQSALLMYPASSVSCHRRFLNPLNGRRYNFTLYELFAEKCIGSSGSWLIMKGRRHYIYNPFTLSKIMWPEKNRPHFYEPVIAFSKPGTPEFTLIAFNGYPQSLHYFRCGDKKWSSPNHNFGFRNEEIIQAVAVGGKFYAMTTRGRLAFIDSDKDMVLEWKDEIRRVQFDGAKEHVYLVESKGELLVAITVCSRFKQHDVSMQACRIFKLDTKTSTWVDARGMMRNQKLFLGRRGSMSVEAREQASMRARARVYTAGEGSFGVFDLDRGEGSIGCVHDHGKPKSTFWVLPEQLFRDREPKWWTALYNTNDCLLDRVYAVLFGLLLLSSISLPLISCIVIIYLFVMCWTLWVSLYSENE